MGIMTFGAMRAPVAACGTGGVPVASSIGTLVLLLGGCESQPPCSEGWKDTKKACTTKAGQPGTIMSAWSPQPCTPVSYCLPVSDDEFEVAE